MNDPTQSQYANPTAPPGGGELISGLPITGFDLVALIAVALALLAFGLALWRLSHPAL